MATMLGTVNLPTAPNSCDHVGVTTQPYYREIADRIRRQIAAGTLKPGDELPAKREIAAEHEVSVEPVTKALQLLEREGVIELRQGKRAKVLPQG